MVSPPRRLARSSAATTSEFSLRPSRNRSSRSFGASAFDHAQWRVGQCDGAVLLDDADAGAHETAVGAAAAAPRFDNFAFGVDRVARGERALARRLHVQKGKGSLPP